MRMRAGRALAGLAVAALAAWAGACKTSAPATSRPEAPLPPTPPPGRVFASVGEAEPELMALEDSRRFEPATLEAAAKSPDAAARARAALCLGRLADQKGR